MPQRRYFYSEADVVKQRQVNQIVLGDHTYTRHERRRRGKIPRRGTGGGTGTGEFLRAFEATEYKRSDDFNLEIVWLDFNNDPVSTGVVYDFDRKFIAVPEGYIFWPAGGTGTEDDIPVPGARGVAMLRQNMGGGTGFGTGLDERWEIIDTETFAKFIIAEYVKGESGTEDVRKQEDWYSFSGVYRDSESFTDWARLDPQVEGEPIRAADFNGTMFLVEPIIGDVVLMMLVDANGFPEGEIPEGWEDQPWAPAYIPVAVFDRGTIVYAGTGTGADLINKTGGGVFPGRICTTVGINPSYSNTVENCWITDLADSDTLLQGAFYIGRFVGLYDPDPEGESNELPRYAIRVNTGAENFRLISGRTGTGIVAAEDEIFSVSDIEPLAGGLDPRDDPEDENESVVIFKFLKEELPPLTWITAVYNPGVHELANWELIIVERPRMIRGEYAGTGTGTNVIRIKAIDVLSSGDDPRLDPTNEDEEVRVKVFSGSFNGIVGDTVYAAFNYEVDTDVDWEMLPISADTDYRVGAHPDDEEPATLIEKIADTAVPWGIAADYDPELHNLVLATTLTTVGGEEQVRLYTIKGTGTGTGAEMFCCTLGEVIEAATLSQLGVGTGDIYRITQEGALVDVGTGVIFNPFRMLLPIAGAGDTILYPCFKTHGESQANFRYTISGLDILHILSALFGFARKKALFVPDGEGDAAETDIGWYGAPCGTGTGT